MNLLSSSVFTSLDTEYKDFLNNTLLVEEIIIVLALVKLTLIWTRILGRLITTLLDIKSREILVKNMIYFSFSVRSSTKTDEREHNQYKQEHNDEILSTQYKVSLSFIFFLYQGAMAQWYSQHTTVLGVVGSIPTPAIVELL